MNWTYLLTSLDGRINRQPFWTALIPLVALEIIAHFALGEQFSAVVSLLLAYPALALLAKRGHDRNAPTWIPGLFMAASVAIDLAVLLDLAGPTDKPSAPFLVFASVVGLFGLVLLIDFGFRRGSVGPNRFGPDPLAP